MDDSGDEDDELKDLNKKYEGVRKEALFELKGTFKQPKINREAIRTL
jgi:hypothetical protein